MQGEYWARKSSSVDIFPEVVIIGEKTVSPFEGVSLIEREGRKGELGVWIFGLVIERIPLLLPSVEVVTVGISARFVNEETFPVEVSARAVVASPHTQYGENCRIFSYQNFSETFYYFPARKKLFASLRQLLTRLNIRSFEWFWMQ